MRSTELDWVAFYHSRHHHISDHMESVASLTEEALDEVQRYIDEYMEEKKEAGGVSGMLARAADFIGDDLFNLW